MVGYRPFCLSGPPECPQSIQATELINFAIIRDHSEAITGIAVSESEVQGPIIAVGSDDASQQVWLQTASPSAIHFIPSAQLPEDVLQAFRGSANSTTPFSVYRLPVDETTSFDAPMA